MTMRQYIRRRVALAFVIAFALLLAVGITMLPNVASGSMNPLLAIAVVGILMLPSALIYFAIRCPRCSKRIFPAPIANRIAFPWLSKVMSEPIQRTCPCCGVDLDDPMPIKPIS